MSDLLFFEDLNVGDSWRSQGRTVTETDVINFASMTGDYNPLHVDREFASNESFGKPIAHGLLGLSWAAGLGSHYPNIRTRAFLAIDKWEFVQPIYPGDTVYVESDVTDLQPKGRRSGLVTWNRRLINQNGIEVQRGTFRTLVSKAVARRRSDNQADRKGKEAATEPSEQRRVA